MVGMGGDGEGGRREGIFKQNREKIVSRIKIDVDFSEGESIHIFLALTHKTKILSATLFSRCIKLD